MRTLRWVSLAILTLLSNWSHAGDVDAIVRAEMEKRKAPGMAVAVVVRGKVRMAKGYGVADLEQGTPVTSQTVFEIGSVTKPFTATAIVLLARQGKLKLDDPVRKHIPEIPDAWPTVTLRHLLTHTSGLKEITLPFSPSISLEEALKKASFERQPGERRTYNNFGFQLLGVVVERASGKRYAEFLRQAVFEPAGMRNTFVPAEGPCATGYSTYFGPRVKAKLLDPKGLPGAGLVSSTLDDLAKWEAAMVDNTVLTKEEQATMHAPQRLANGESIPYGLAWSLIDDGGRRAVSHDGLTMGFAATIVRYIDDGVTVVVLCNLANLKSLRPMAQEIARTIIERA